MKVLETVLSFFLTLAQVIFPRKRKPSPSDRPCPPPQPRPPVPPVPLEGGNGSDPGLHRRDSLPPEKQPSPSPHLPKNRGSSADSTDSPDFASSADSTSSSGSSSSTDSAPAHKPPPADWLGISGYTLIVCGGAGYVCRWLMG